MGPFYSNRSHTDNGLPSETVRLLEEIKEQLDRLENQLKTERVESENSINELKTKLETKLEGSINETTNELERALGGLNLPLKDIGLNDLDLNNSLSTLAPLLQNPEGLMNNPLIKMLPLFANSNFKQIFEIVQKFQRGEIPAPSELLPLAKTFFGKQDQEVFMASNNPVRGKIQSMQAQLTDQRFHLENTIKQLETMNNEALALLEIAELLALRKQQ